MRPPRAITVGGIFRLSALLFLIGLLVGCGYKTNPESLKQPLPRAIKQLEIRQVGKAMRLSWVAPLKNQDGSPMTDLDGFLIFRGFVSDDDQCPECGETTNPLVRIGFEFPKPAFRSGNRFFFFDQDLVEKTGYRYRVTPLNNAGYRGTPERGEGRFFPVPPPPSALTATGLDSLIRLSWTAPIPSPSGFELIGYHLYRSDTTDGPLLEQLTTTPVAEVEFDDGRAKPGVTYRYIVRAVYRRDNIVFESMATRPVKASSAPGIQTR